MYNVMIVDDEEPVLESYAHMIEHTALGFTLCSKARTGHEAMARVHECRPDVVFMDIGLPGIDGLETISAMQQQFPEILFVISTAYERFDIAKRAIPLGVVSYLVKPISKRTFLKTLEQVQELLDEKQRRITAQVREMHHAADLQAWEVKNFLTLITWKRLEEEQWHAHKERFSLLGDHAMICLLEIGPSGESSIEDLYSTCAHQIAFKYQCLSTEYLGRLLVFITGAENRERIVHALEYIVQQYLPDGITCRIGAGGIEPYDRLYRSCSDAMEQLSGDDRSADLLQLQQQIETVRSVILQSRPWDVIEQESRTLSELLLFSNSFSLAKKRLIGVITLLLDDLYRSLQAMIQVAVPFDYIREIDRLQDHRQWDLWYARTIRFIAERSRQYHMENRPIPLRKALLYIDEHYRSTLDLSHVAQACGISAAYLSRLCTEHLHTTFIDHLTSVRISHARQLLRTGDASVKEIAYQTGYQDPNYFSKIFKKITGVTPTSYQRGDT
ncbi:MAG: helix-turn-helix domain-containing protein [Spirochaetia bacterium]|nr:helix-turn-helix domain-containing protein [Spirochaetia bacterium]